MRPIYETQEDLDKEGAVITKLQQTWVAAARKLPIKYGLDYAFIRNRRVVSFCEIKVRNYSMEQIQQFGGYLLSVGKWMSAKALTQSTQIPFVLVVQTKDGLYYSVFDKDFLHDGVIIGGRTDRDDWDDVEPCVLLNIKRFTKLPE